MSKIEIGPEGEAYVEILPATYANSSEGARISWTTELAAISRGKDKSANPPKRYEALKSEAEGGKPSRPFEFLPVSFPAGYGDKFEIEDELEIMRMMSYSHIDKNDIVYTNMRALINSGAKYSSIPFSEEIRHFAAFRIKAPMFVWAQIVTHTKLSTESQSDRVAEEQSYWLPSDLGDRLSVDTVENRDMVNRYTMDYISEDGKFSIKDFSKWMLDHAPQNKVQEFLKKLGYPREIYSRAPYYFKMKEFVITGWTNNDDSWPHFLRERNAYMDDGGPKNWTQPETQLYAAAIRTLLEKHTPLTKESVLDGMDHYDKA